MTTKQIAEAYGTNSSNVTKAFNRNKDKYTNGKHYFLLTGDEKKEFVNQVQIVSSSKKCEKPLPLDGT